MSLSNLYQAVSQSLGLAAQNAVTPQLESNVIHQAVTTQGVNLIYSVDTAAAGDVAQAISQSDVPASLTNFLGTVRALGPPA